MITNNQKKAAQTAALKAKQWGNTPTATAAIKRQTEQRRQIS